MDVEREEDRKIPWTMMGVGIGLALFGFTIYYVIPLSLLAENLTVLLNVFFAMLILMIMGVGSSFTLLSTALTKMPVGPFEYEYAAAARAVPRDISLVLGKKCYYRRSCEKLGTEFNFLSQTLSKFKSHNIRRWDIELETKRLV